MSLIRDNLLTREFYTPYCGNDKCVSMPRTLWNGEQFECNACKWKSEFEPEFIKKYKEFRKTFDFKFKVPL